ncbi:MAG TPA: DUF885 family protein [Thermoanaerobaculia bacterium]|nr:DUF885 family protein [Thermoanaerobaculia bacterium]
MQYDRQIRIAITDAGGLVASALLSEFSEAASFRHGALDVTDGDAVRRALAGFELALNCAVVGVDAAEGEPELARRVNVEGAANVAAAVAVHFSSNYVLDPRSAAAEHADDRRAAAARLARGAAGVHFRGVKTASALLLLAIAIAMPAAAQPLTPATLHSTAHDFYAWRQQHYPVFASDQGMHTWDEQLTDYSAAAIEERRAHVRRLLARLHATDAKQWARDDRIDFILFRSQIERTEFGDRILRSEETNPLAYVGDASNAIFSLLKKEYAPPRTRALAAAARLEAMPAMIAEARRNLRQPVRLYAQLAIDSARGIDSLFATADTLAADLTPGEKQRLTAARTRASKAFADFASWLESGLAKMPAWKAMGEADYNWYLHHALLLPIDAKQLAMLGEAELARYRALESLLPDPSLADPDPKRAANIPRDQEAFLRAYQSRQEEMIRFLGQKKLITIPPYIGAFLIRQLPEAFKPTSPGGFMNPPGLYDKDSSGFYFIPTYDPASRNFYIRAAIEDPRPILGHEGIPGHFLQLSISNHLSNEIRREHYDGVFAEGWALYTEEMLMRTGLYAPDSAASGQILRLSRYRAARIGVDVNLHTGRWPFEEAVKYFMEAGGLDREAAEGEAAGAASDPTQKISYITGKWQIMRLLGKYRDRKGAAFRLGQFHDELLGYGTLPLSVVEWLMFDDPSSLEEALK